MNTERPTLDKLLDDLETAKNMALEDRHINGMITATLAQAKLLGYDKGEGDKEDNSAQPVNITIHRVDAKRYTDADIDRQPDGSFFIKPPIITKTS